MWLWFWFSWNQSTYLFCGVLIGPKRGWWEIFGDEKLTKWEKGGDANQHHFVCFYSSMYVLTIYSCMLWKLFSWNHQCKVSRTEPNRTKQDQAQEIVLHNASKEGKPQPEQSWTMHNTALANNDA